MKLGGKQESETEMQVAVNHRQQVTQHELRQMNRLGTKIDELLGALADAKKNRGELEASVLAMLQEGIPVQGGTFGAEIKTTPGRRCPSWKKLHEAKVGKPKIDQIIATTPLSAEKKSVNVVTI